MEVVKLQLIIYGIIFSIIFFVWIFIEYKRKSKKQVNDSLKQLEKERHEYYLKLILSLMDGRMKQLSTTLYLQKVPSMFYYYSMDDTAIYVDEPILEALNRKSVNSKIDSCNNLILSYKNE